MTPARRSREEYSALIARAFNGAITVDGQRIVAHPSGMLFAKTAATRAAVQAFATVLTDRDDAAESPAGDNDWSDV
jgi:hypothetical protein